MEELLTRPAPPRMAPLASSPGPGCLVDAGTWPRCTTSPIRQPGHGEGHRSLDRLVAWRHSTPLLVTLAVLALVLHGRTLWTSYWGDEAIAVGIAAHPLGSLPHYLVDDGSPPLYYVTLHYWMRLFGSPRWPPTPCRWSRPARHTGGLVVGGTALRSMGGSGGGRAGGHVRLPGLYSTEARMYSWLVLVALLAITCFVLAYRGAGRRYWVAATLLMAAVLYLQYYGLYLLAATVIVGSAVAARRRAWSQLRATWLYGAACAVLFSPWAAQFLYQLRNTGAPWAPHPAVLDFFGDSFNALASAAWAAIVIALIVAVLSRRRPPPAGAPDVAPASPARAGRLSAGPVHRGPLVTLLLAWLVGQVVNSWDPRYLGIAVVPALVPLAGGLARARGRTWVAGLDGAGPGGHQRPGPGGQDRHRRHLEERRRLPGIRARPSPPAGSARDIA